MATDTAESVHTNAARRQLSALTSAIGDISSRFLEPADLDAAIDYALERLGTSCEADHAQLFQFSGRADAPVKTHTWSAPGVERQISGPDSVHVETVPWWVDRLQAARKRVAAHEASEVMDLKVLPAPSEKA